jgi:excisionase family DNA binding protein
MANVLPGPEPQLQDVSGQDTLLGSHLGSPGAARALLPVAEVARRCALSPKTIRAAIARGDLRAYRLVGRIRVAPADLSAWLAASQVAVNGSPQIPDVPSRARHSHPLALRRLAAQRDRE